jgi:hypothetical protein
MRATYLEDVCKTALNEVPKESRVPGEPAAAGS